jgi:hypothetical protein
VGGALNVGSRLVRTKVRKLQVDSEIVLPQHGDYVLERVTVLATDPHQIALD